MADDFFSPHARGQGGAGRGRGIRLPDAGDVSRVGIQGDPGVNVPDMGGVARALSGVGADMAQATNAFAEAAARQQRQTDAIATAENNLGVQKQLGEDWNEWQVTRDTADPNFYKDWTQHVEERHNEAFAGLGDKVSQSAQAEYRVKLAEQALSWGDSAGVAHLNAMQKKAIGLGKEQINVAAAQASANPEHADAILNQTLKDLSAFDDTMTSEAETALRNSAADTVVSAAAFSLVDQGRTDEAQALLNSPKYAKIIEPARREQLNDQVRNRAEQLARAALVDEQRAAIRAEKIARQVSEQKQGDYLVKLGETMEPGLMRDAMTDTDMLAADRTAVVSAIAAQTAREEHEGRIATTAQAQQAGISIANAIHTDDPSVTQESIAANPYLTESQRNIYSKALDVKERGAAAVTARDNKAGNESTADALIADIVSDNPKATPQSIAASTLDVRTQISMISLFRSTTKAADEAKRDAVKKAMLQDIHSANPSLTKADITSNPVLSSTDIAFVLTQMGKAPSVSEISAITAPEITRRIYLPDGDPQKITDKNQIISEYTNGNLTHPALDQQIAELDRSRTEDGTSLGKAEQEFYGSIEPRINPLSQFGVPRDPRGKQQMAKFRQMARRKREEYIKASKDPFALLDASSPDYLGKDEILGQYQTPIVKQMEDIIIGLSGDAGTAPVASDQAPTSGGSDTGMIDVTTATRTGTHSDGRKVYEIGGKWVYINGKPVE